jgi:uncharacterized protein (TIGR02246 family)
MVMNTLYKVSLSIMLASLIACSGDTQAVKDRELVGSLTKEVTSAFNSGDVNKLVNIFTDDAIVISCGWRMSGKDSIAGGMKYMLEHSSDMVISPGVSNVSDDNVFLEGLVTLNWKNEDYSALAKGVITIIWKKQNDSTWKITFEEENHGDIPGK